MDSFQHRPRQTVRLEEANDSEEKGVATEFVTFQEAIDRLISEASSGGEWMIVSSNEEV